MKKIVILGSSLVGVKIIEQMRNADSQDEITIISSEKHYPYNRDLFSDYISNKIALKETYYKPESFYKENNIEVLWDKKVIRVNLNKKEVTFEDKTKKDFDLIIIADSIDEKLADIKGINKDGAHGIEKLKDIEQIAGQIPIVETITIRSNSLKGLKLATAIAERGREVRLFRPKPQEITLNGRLNNLINQLKEKNLTIYENIDIVEILGDSDVKAVKTSEGKVYATHLILLDDSLQDWRLFSDQTLSFVPQLTVDEKYKTVSDIAYAADRVIQRKDGQSYNELADLEAQGKIIFAALSGQELAIDEPVKQYSIKFEGFKLSKIGSTVVSQEVTRFQRNQDEAGKSKEIFVRDGILLGAILVNCDEEKGKFLQLITNKVNVSGQEQELIHLDEIVSVAVNNVTENQSVNEDVSTEQGEN